jgi:hypothetical protein
MIEVSIEADQERQMAPTPEQIETYRRDGFIVVEHSRYRRPGELEIGEPFFPIMWTEDGNRTPFIDSEYAPAAA